MKPMASLSSFRFSYKVQSPSHSVPNVQALTPSVVQDLASQAPSVLWLAVRKHTAAGGYPGAAARHLQSLFGSQKNPCLWSRVAQQK